LFISFFSIKAGIAIGIVELRSIYGIHMKSRNCIMGGLRMSKKKILIVDDQIGIRLLLQEVFSGDGYTTYQASNGRLALELVKQEKPDLVLLDMKIPGMD